MKFKPKNRKELEAIIKEIITNQEKETSYPYGLKDIHENASTDNIRSRGCGCENASMDNIRSRGLSETFYPYGLRDVDTSLVDDMSNLFSCYTYKNNNINKKINWNDPRNNVTNWDVSNVTNMYNMFYNNHFNQDISNWNVSGVINMEAMFINSNFNQDLCNWVLKLNSNCNLVLFNESSSHEEKYGIIDSYEDFIKNHLTKQFIDKTLQNGNDKEKYQLLKIIKKHPHIVKNLNISREILL